MSGIVCPTLISVLKWQRSYFCRNLEVDFFYSQTLRCGRVYSNHLQQQSIFSYQKILPARGWALPAPPCGHAISNTKWAKDRQASYSSTRYKHIFERERSRKVGANLSIQYVLRPVRRPFYYVANGAWKVSTRLY